MLIIVSSDTKLVMISEYLFHNVISSRIRFRKKKIVNKRIFQFHLRDTNLLYIRIFCANQKLENIIFNSIQTAPPERIIFELMNISISFHKIWSCHVVLCEVERDRIEVEEPNETITKKERTLNIDFIFKLCNHFDFSIEINSITRRTCYVSFIFDSSSHLC